MSHHEHTEARVIPLRAPTPLASVQGSLALDLTPRTAPPRPRLRSTRTFDLVAVAAAERGHVDAQPLKLLRGRLPVGVIDREQVLRHDRSLPFVIRSRSLADPHSRYEVDTAESTLRLPRCQKTLRRARRVPTLG